jgi:fructosamine-3-kinase
MERLEEWLGPVERQPSLLHGDLWRENVLTDARGEPALADPCAFFGDREFELAYAELAGMPPAFFEAYRDAWPLAPGYAERRDLYLLYYVIGELLYGNHTIPRLESVLRWYLGSR